MVDFVEFRKIPRLTRECVVTEKIDGTNGVIYIGEDGEFLVGSRTRWITPQNDNHGFAMWCMQNKEQLMGLGIGTHYGEWWGTGIQRGYNLSEKRFSLFNTKKWNDDVFRPKCCSVVPTLYEGVFDTFIIDGILNTMKEQGSRAVPGYMNPEGIVIYHKALNGYFKKTIEKDDEYKGKGRLEERAR